jgi:hypothetical protein
MFNCLDLKGRFFVKDEDLAELQLRGLLALRLNGKVSRLSFLMQNREGSQQEKLVGYKEI